MSLSGVAARSEALHSDLEKRFPEDTFVKFTYAPILRALALQGKGRFEESVVQLEVARSHELAVHGLNFPYLILGGLHAAYVRGEALAASHRHAEAAAEFQKILDHPGFAALDAIGVLAHLQLGRVFELSGDQIKAKAAYRAFLEAWRDADPDVPILKRAKAAHSKL